MVNLTILFQKLGKQKSHVFISMISICRVQSNKKGRNETIDNDDNLIFNKKAAKKCIVVGRRVCKILTPDDHIFFFFAPSSHHVTMPADMQNGAGQHWNKSMVRFYVFNSWVAECWRNNLISYASATCAFGSNEKWRSPDWMPVVIADPHTFIKIKTS